MSVPAIALYATPPGCVFSPQDFDHASASTSSSGGATATARPIVGGLSCLFASPLPVATAAASSTRHDDLGALWHHDRADDFSSGGSYSRSPFKHRDHSPASVLHGANAASPSSSSPASLGRDWRTGRDRIFSTLVRNALGSCLDYVPAVHGEDEYHRLGRDSGELDFDMEENLGEPQPNCEPFAKQLLASAQATHKVFNEEIVVKAFYEAEMAHRGQMRANGDHYLQHCIETAVLLAKVGANATVVSAGLLHDVIDDSFIDYDHILHAFGSDVADLVQGVSKLSELSQLARKSDTASRTAEADRLHTMFLAMADARAVLIKLADRLHNMMTLEALPPNKQRSFAKETLEIFVPLANRLGIFSWKEQLETICFKHLNPAEHRELSSKLTLAFDEALVTSAIEKLERVLHDEHVLYHHLSGRHKSLYSIHSKMIKKSLTMDEIHDIHGLRLIVHSEEDCYRALEIVHDLWPEMPSTFKDYISHPKINGYRSLHTVVRSDGGHPFEVQIRTRDMHLQAEFGFAAHWRYKEGSCRHSFIIQMVEWARWVLTWQCEVANKDRNSFSIGRDVVPPCPLPSHSDGCPYSYTSRCNHIGPVFVIVLENEKMSVQELPANSNLTDLIERIGRSSAFSSAAKEELRPKVNRVTATDPHLKLSMGDVVELTPALSDRSLTDYREKMQRMYDAGSPYLARTAAAVAAEAGSAAV